MKTIAQQLNVTDFPFIVKDKNSKQLYYETSDGYWEKWEYDSEGNVIYYQDSTEYWRKFEYNSAGNEIYYENSDGVIEDKRPSENAESTMILRELFRQIRLGKHNHLGLGDIRLTVAQQDEICYLVESLINKRIDQ